VLTAGFTRYRAVEYINTVIQPENPIPLKVMNFEGNDLKADIQNIVENLDRNGTDMLDDAYNQLYLRETHLMSDEDICKLYHCSIPWLEKLKGLLTLSQPVIDAIINGEVVGSVCMQMVGMAESEQNDALREMKEKFSHAIDNGQRLGFTAEIAATQAAKEAAVSGNKGGKPKGSTKGKSKASKAALAGKILTGIVRQKKLAKGEKGKALSLAEIKSFFSEIIGPDATAHAPEVKEFCKKFLDWQGTEITTKQFENALYKLAESKCSGKA